VTSPGEDEIGAICPYLGLADDPESHATYATEAHRCYRMPTPTRIALNHQETFCLGGAYANCPVYRGEGVPGARPAAPSGAARPAAASRPASPPRTAGSAGTRPGAGRAPAGRGASPGMMTLPRRGGGISMPVATVGLFALALGLVVLAVIIQRALGGGGDELTAAERFQTQQALAGATPTAPAQTPAPGTATATAAATGTPAGTPAATPSPTPGGRRTYIVKAGDTCYGIAQEFGITVEQLRAANNLDEACSIYPDQELVIPNP